MLALLGFATIIIVIALLLRNVTVPALAFVSVSTVTGAILVATGTFTIEEMGEFVTAGVAEYMVLQHCLSSLYFSLEL